MSDFTTLATWFDEVDTIPDSFDPEPLWRRNMYGSLDFIGPIMPPMLSFSRGGDRSLAVGPRTIGKVASRSALREAIEESLRRAERLVVVSPAGLPVRKPTRAERSAARKRRVKEILQG